MTFEEAIKKSIKQYYEMDDDNELEINKSGERQYTKKYFKDFEEEILGDRKFKESKQ